MGTAMPTFGATSISAVLCEVGGGVEWQWMDVGGLGSVLLYGKVLT
jgi:hypothetical protein